MFGWYKIKKKYTDPIIVIIGAKGSGRIYFNNKVRNKYNK